MPVTTHDGQWFEDEFEYQHHRAFVKPQQDWDALLEPHKWQYLNNNPDVHHDEMQWPSINDHRGLEFLKTVNRRDFENYLNKIEQDAIEP